MDGAAKENDYEDDHRSGDHNYQSEESKVDEKPKKKKKEEKHNDVYKTLNVVNLSILK